MRHFQRGAPAVCLAALLAAFPPAHGQSRPAAADGPYLVHVSDTRPGYTVVASGGGYDPATVRVVVHVPGTPASQRAELGQMIGRLAERYDGAPEPPSLPPQAQTHVLTPLCATGRSVFATLPAHPYPPGYVAVVWLADGERLSNPVVLNKPQAWFLLKGVSRPGELNRVCGFNLRGDRYVPRYVFLRSSAGAVRLAAEEPRHREDGVSENFCLQFRLPDDLQPGRYDVFVHNNSGGPYGFTEPLELEVTLAPDFPQVLYMATEHGARGDSLSDNLPPLQELIDTAGEQGGGIVFLPPGSYRLSDTLQLRPGVILRGAGRDATTLFYAPSPAGNNRSGWLISARGVNHTGLEDLTIRTCEPKEMAVSYYDGGRPTYQTHILRCRFVGGSVSVNYNVNMELGHCILEGGRFHAHNLQHAWIHHNEFTVGRLGGNPVSIWASENCTVEHNLAHGSNRGFVWQIHGRFGHLHNFIDANCVRDARLGGNAGETYLFEGAGFQWHGTPSAVSADGFAVDSPAWEPGELEKSFAVVTAGRGLGQYARIRSNTPREVRLAAPWRVTPSGDVSISILRGVVENAITNNRHVDCDNSMMFYGCGLLNNRIHRNRSENSLGISVWSLADAAKGVLVPDYYNEFDSNVLEDQGGFWLTRRVDSRQQSGVRNLNNVFRNNFLADVRRKRENQYGNVWEQADRGMYRPVQSAFWFGVGRSSPSDPEPGPIWIDALIERNYVTRCEWGIELRAIAAGTFLCANTFFDVERPILDEGAGTVLLDNRIEYPGDPAGEPAAGAAPQAAQ